MNAHDTGALVMVVVFVAWSLYALVTDPLRGVNDE